MSEMLYFISCLQVCEKVEESQSGSHNWACSFYYRDIANLCNRILNIDQLEMKHMFFSGGSIVTLVETLLRTYLTSLQLVTGTVWRR